MLGPVSIIEEVGVGMTTLLGSATVLAPLIVAAPLTVAAAARATAPIRTAHRCLLFAMPRTLLRAVDGRKIRGSSGSFQPCARRRAGWRINVGAERLLPHPREAKDVSRNRFSRGWRQATVASRQ